VKCDRSINPGVLVTAVVLFLLSAVTYPVSAAELAENIFLHGFVSQGYLNTSENDYLVPRSVHGTAAFTEAAITVTATPMDRLRVGIQFLGRNFGNMGNDQVLIDWAYGDYRWKDQLGFRAGKVKMPFGLYNEGRDVDMLRTSIFLPQSIYNEKMRDLILAYEGAGAYGNFDMHGAGELDYHVYVGTLSVPDTGTGFWRDIFSSTSKDLEPLVGLAVDNDYGNSPGTAEASFRSMDDVGVSFPWIYGGAVNWYTPLTGLRFGSAAMVGRYNIQTVLRYDVDIPDDPGNNGAGYHPYAIDIDQTHKINHITTFSAEYVRNDLTLAAEYYHDDFNNNTTRGWYVLAGNRFSRLLSLSVYFSDAEPIGGDDAKSLLKLSGLPDYYGWQRDLTISSRFDLTDFWLFKLEYHFIDGVALTQPRTREENLADPLEQHWGMFVAKTTFHF